MSENIITLKAFHNKTHNKQNVLSQLQNHYNADEIIKGTYWKNGKGCAVGCTIHSGNHKCYEIELGIPEWLARLEDYLFENLPNKKAKEFPILFIKAIPVGFKNWSKFYHNICVYILTDIIKTESDEKVIKAIKDIITLHIKASKGEIESNLSATWSAAKSAVESAAWSITESATESAVRSTSWLAARSAAWSAARSTSWLAIRSAARSAAWSAARSTSCSTTWSATSSTTWSATSSTTWSATWSAAESAAVVKIADKLLELLEAEK